MSKAVGCSGTGAYNSHVIPNAAIDLSTFVTQLWVLDAEQSIPLPSPAPPQRHGQLQKEVETHLNKYTFCGMGKEYLNSKH